MTDPLRNGKDPLRAIGPEAEQELFRQITRMCDGFPRQVVENVAGYLLTNSIRQQHSSWQDAERGMKDHHGRFMQILSDHYDKVNGRKKGIFPYAQHLTVNTPVLAENRFMLGRKK